MSINNDNIVKIGVALKWRNTFDLTKKYYQENVVTACGCVFRCKVLQAQGKSPIKMTDDQGHIVYTNTDVWDVLVDMAYYYNYAVDTRKLTQQMSDYAKKLDEALQKQQKEIEALQKDNRDQWNHINDIEKVNTEQQRELNSIFDTISCFSEGIWIDTLLWSNETIWDNNKYAITDDLQNQINVLDENHRQDIEDLTEKHNTEISALAAHVARQEKIQMGINEYLQDQINVLDENHRQDIEDLTEKHNTEISALAADIKKLDEHLSKSDKAFEEAMLENAKEHGLVNTHLQKHDREMKDLQDLIKEHDEQIIDLIDTLACFSNGYWDNGLKWSNVALWENSNLMYNMFEDIYSQIEGHQSEYQKMLDDIRAYNGCFEKGEWADPFFWNDTDIWYNSPNSISEAENDIISHNSRLTALESQFVLFIQQYTTQQTIIEQHQNQLETLMDCFTVLNVGKWQNLLLWDNTSKWSNALITEAAASVGTGGSSTVTVKSYDPDTATVTI